MSLSELTRNAIMAGVSSDKWETLVRRWVERKHPTSFPRRVLPAFGTEIWKGIRPLLRVFPRDKTLQLYLQKAMDSNLLPLRLYAVGLLAWIAEDIIRNQDAPVQEEELALVDMLCQMAISIHYAKNGGLGGILQPHTVVSVTGPGYHPKPRRIPEASLDVSTLMETAINAADFCKYSLTLQATEAAEQVAAAASNSGTHPPHTPSHPSPSSSGPFYHTLHTTSSEILSFVLDSIDQSSASVAPHNLIARLFPLMKDLNDVSAFLSPTCAAHVMQWTHHLAFVALSSPGDMYRNLFSGSGLGSSAESVEGKSNAATGQTKATPQPYVSDGLDVRSVMLLRLLVDSADTIGSGNQSSAIGRLLATYRSMESDAQVFLDNIILASIRILAQTTQLARSHLDPSSLPEDLVRWRIFTLSRLPVLLARLAEVIDVALSDERPQLAPGTSGFHSSLKLSLTTLFIEHSDLLDACAYDDHPFKTRSPDLFGEDEEMNEDDGQDAEKGTLAFKADLLVGYQAVSLIDPETVLQLAGRDISSVTGNGKILADADENGVPIEAYITTKLEADMSLEEALGLIDTAVWDYSSHLILVHLVQQKYATVAAAETANLESLAFISRVLHTHHHLLDIITLHQSSIMVNLVGSALAFASCFSFANVGDVQTALGHFGDIVLFIQTAFRRFRYRLNHETFVGKNGQPIDPRVFVSAHSSLPISCLSQGDQQIARSWLKAIFDLNSEGIDDELLRSTAPQSLLRLTPSLFVQALSDYVATGSSDRETLKNGASFFHGDLLNWTLPGVLVALVEDTQRQGAAASIHVELLSIIIASSGCPRPALLLAGFALLRLFGSEPFKSLAQAVNVDIVPLKNRIRNALGLVSLDSSQPIIRNKSVPYIDAPRLIIRDALAHASMDPLPLNLPILFHYPPNHIVMGLFHELRSTTSSTEGTELLSPQATAVSVSILTTPRGSSAAPRSKSPSSIHETLLPYTLKVFLPNLISGITDAETVALEMDILCAMIGTSVVAQRQYERATRVLAAYSSRVGEDVDVDPMPQDEVSLVVTPFVQWLKERNASAVRASLLKRLHAVPEYTGHFVVG